MNDSNGCGRGLEKRFWFFYIYLLSECVAVDNTCCCFRFVCVECSYQEKGFVLFSPDH